MLATTVEKGEDRDEYLPFVLFAYRASAQQSSCESPFFLIYERDRRLPTESMMCPPKDRATMDLREYGVELVSKMARAWDFAQKCIGRAQTWQKTFSDKNSQLPNFAEGDSLSLQASWKNWRG